MQGESNNPQLDADNAAAIQLYTSLGFTRWETDVMFGRS